MIIDEFRDFNVCASTKKGEHIKLIFDMGNDEVVIELSKRNAKWLQYVLKKAIDVKKC